MLQALSELVPLVPGFLRDRPGNGVWYERKELSDGVRGTAQTIAEMQKIVATGMLDHEVLNVVGKVLWGEFNDIPECSSKDYLCYAKSLYLFCRDHIKYVYDPHLVEYVEEVRRILDKRIADCDSIVPVLCAMLQGIGLECEFVTIMAAAERPDEYSHVYCRVKVPGKGWIALDPTMPKKWFGWEPPSYFKKKHWHACAHSLDMPLDEEESLKVTSPSGLGLGPDDTFRMGALGHRRRHRGGGGYMAPYYPYPAFGPEVYVLQDTQAQQMPKVPCATECAQTCAGAYDPAVDKEKFADCSSDCASRRCASPAGIPDQYPLGISGLSFMGATRARKRVPGQNKPKPRNIQMTPPPLMKPKYKLGRKAGKPGILKGLFGLGAGETTLDQLSESWSRLDMDFKSNVQTDPMISLSTLEVQRRDIDGALNRFTTWIDLVRSGRQELATAVGVLDGIASNILDMKRRLAAAKAGQAVPPAAPRVVPSVVVVPPIPAEPSATSWLPWVIGGVAVIGIAYAWSRRS